MHVDNQCRAALFLGTYVTLEPTLEAPDTQAPAEGETASAAAARVAQFEARAGARAARSRARLAVGTGVVGRSEDEPGDGWYAFRARVLWHFRLDVVHAVGAADDIVETQAGAVEAGAATASGVLAGADALERRRLAGVRGRGVRGRRGSGR